VVIDDCGHVGLPLAIAFGDRVRVYMYDVSERAVERVNAGQASWPTSLSAAAPGLRAPSQPGDRSLARPSEDAAATPMLSGKHRNKHFYGLLPHVMRARTRYQTHR